VSRVGLVLASGSPARLKTLRAAGVEPRVVVPGVDESQLSADEPAVMCLRLAALKGRAVATGLSRPDRPTVLLGCDSVLEFEGAAFGKPRSAADAVRRLSSMRGGRGVLHTGHFLLDVQTGDERLAGAATVVHFGWLADAEIAAYVGTGEPLGVAGAFTIDGLGGPFVDGIEGDPHNVVGLSLPLVRRMLGELGYLWFDLW
jgi:septum formation protein